MHSSGIQYMARGKSKSIAIKMISTAGTGYFYRTRKNPIRTPDKFIMKKYDPVVQRHVLFKEAKINKSK